MSRPDREARAIGEIITPEFVERFNPDKWKKRLRSARRVARLLAHLALDDFIAPPLSHEGERRRYTQRRDRVLGWIETCPRCRAATCQCGGLIHD